MSKLESAPSYFRSSPSRGIEESQSVVRDGGDYGAGLIRGASAISRGEAMGRGLWIDATMLDQVAEALGKSSGVKSRFTHPDMSSDGLGKQLGRAKAGRRLGDKTLVDLHLLQSAHDAPDGDLSGYVMDLAEESPEDFGLSIVFQLDRDSMDAFSKENTREVEVVNERGETEKRKVFRSPDPLNKKNLRHARLKALRAVDVVDDPAANEGGLFHRAPDELKEGEALLEYCLGLRSDAPELISLDVHPDRVSGFLQRFMDSHGLELRAKEKDQMDEQQIFERAQKELAARITDYTDRFGPQGQAWALSSRPLADCYADLVTQLRSQHASELAAAKAAGDAAVADLTAKLESKTAEATELADKLATVQLGESKPVSTAAADPTEAALTAGEKAGLTPNLQRYVAAQRAAKAKK